MNVFELICIIYTYKQFDILFLVCITDVRYVLFCHFCVKACIHGILRVVTRFMCDGDCDVTLDVEENLSTILFYTIYVQAYISEEFKPYANLLDEKLNHFYFGHYETKMHIFFLYHFCIHRLCFCSTGSYILYNHLHVHKHLRISELCLQYRRYQFVYYIHCLFLLFQLLLTVNVLFFFQVLSYLQASDILYFI